MKFIIDRASEYDIEVMPHKLAHKEEVKYVEKYCFKNFDDYNHSNNVLFCKKPAFEQVGFDHKVLPYGGGICRTVLRTEWVIEFDTLEDLIKFIEENDDVVIYRKGGYEYNRLTIYDGYIE